MSTRENIRLIARAPLLNLLQKRDKMLSKPRIYLFSQTHLINSIKHEHSCKILYISMRWTECQIHMVQLMRFWYFSYTVYEASP